MTEYKVQKAASVVELTAAERKRGREAIRFKPGLGGLDAPYLR